MHAVDQVRLGSTARLYSVLEADMRDHASDWDRLPAPERHRAVTRAVDADLVPIQREARGRNKVLLTGVDKLLKSLKGDTTYVVTHVDIGSSSQAVSENDIGTVTHVDAAVGKARIAITTKTVASKTLQTSSFIQSNEYLNTTLREACLFDAATGGTAYNRVLFGTPLARPATAIEVAICNIDHTLTN